jgi:hypothetical protein
MKTCSSCGLEKLENEFREKRNQCLLCYSQYLKDYREKNKEKLKQERKEAYGTNPEKFRESNKKSYEKHKDIRLLNNREYYNEHQEELVSYQKEYRTNPINKKVISQNKKLYYKENKETIIEKKIVYQRNRYQTDPFYRLRSLVGRVVTRMLVSQGSSKNGGSIRDHLPYDIQELKVHLEQQFEPWMTWDNQGKFDPETWIDNDPSTWTWQLDHIIPQSDLPYTSMDDDNFKKCWALSNLRPLSSKQNLLDGSKRTRHG